MNTYLHHSEYLQALGITAWRLRRPVMVTEPMSPVTDMTAAESVRSPATVFRMATEPRLAMVFASRPSPAAEAMLARMELALGLDASQVIWMGDDGEVVLSDSTVAVIGFGVQREWPGVSVAAPEVELLLAEPSRKADLWAKLQSVVLPVLT